MVSGSVPFTDALVFVIDKFSFGIVDAVVIFSKNVSSAVVIVLDPMTPLSPFEIIE
jgi:hypothetical protein